MSCVGRHSAGGAPKRDQGSFGKEKLAALQRHLEAGRVGRIAEQEIGDAQGGGIGGSGGGDAQGSKTGPSEVLHGGEEAGRLYLDVTHTRMGRKRTRSPVFSTLRLSREGSKSFRSVLPIMRQPPGVEME